MRNLSEKCSNEPRTPHRHHRSEPLAQLSGCAFAHNSPQATTSSRREGRHLDCWTTQPPTQAQQRNPQSSTTQPFDPRKKLIRKTNHRPRSTVHSFRSSKKMNSKNESLPCTPAPKRRLRRRSQATSSSPLSLRSSKKMNSKNESLPCAPAPKRRLRRRSPAPPRPGPSPWDGGYNKSWAANSRDQRRSSIYGRQRVQNTQARG